MGLLDGTTQADYYSGDDFGNYQFTSLNDIINQFMVIYVGEDKIVPKIKRTDIAFHAQRALQELSFDTLKSCKSREITIPATLQMPLPRDYVNYTKVSWVDSAGIKHLLYPASKTSNPEKYQEDTDGDYLFDSNGDLIHSGELIKNGNFNGGSTNWALNKIYLDNGGQGNPGSATQPVSFSANVPTVGDPIQGWHYTTNKLEAFDIVTDQGVIQEGIPIKAGESYIVSIKATITSGTFSVILVDQNGDTTSMTAITSSGTYTETLETSSTASSIAQPSCIMVKNTSTTNAYGTIDNISVKRVTDEETSTTWSSYKSATPSENNNDDYEDDTYWPMAGSRYGLDPQHAQINGSFYIDCRLGKIHFSSNISGKTVILDYISDSVGTDEEMQVHKFAEEAMYKCIICSILSASSIPFHQQLLPRYKKDRFAAIRTAKLRLSNLKLEELTQILRGKSKQIKH